VPRIVVIHYEPAEAASLAERLRREGFDAEPYSHRGAKGFRGLRENPPDAILIDLFRLPSYGKAMGALLREQKGTRAIPLVFLEGDPEKAARVCQVLPDAGYAPLERIGAALRRAISRPPADPVQPQLNVSLVEKLKITDRSAVALVNAPEDFALPGPARIVRKAADADVVLTFVRSAAGLGRELPSIARDLRPGRSHWIVWQKGKSGKSAGLSMVTIREMCRAYGLIDYKVCAVDGTWSAMVIARQQRQRAPAEEQR
jgi:CheY-like chemotaxis protein